jgi:hypothetical protein
MTAVACPCGAGPSSPYGASIVSLTAVRNMRGNIPASPQINQRPGPCAVSCCRSPAARPRPHSGATCQRNPAPLEPERCRKGRRITNVSACSSAGCFAAVTSLPFIAARNYPLAAATLTASIVRSHTRSRRPARMRRAADYESSPPAARAIWSDLGRRDSHDHGCPRFGHAFGMIMVDAGAGRITLRSGASA